MYNIVLGIWDIILAIIQLIEYCNGGSALNLILGVLLLPLGLILILQGLNNVF